MSLARCSAPAALPHPYNLNDMDFSTLNFNEAAAIWGLLKRGYLQLLSRSLHFIPLHVHYVHSQQ